MSNLSEIVEQCLAERREFRKNQTRYSPACIELFRRAFAGDEAAWEAIFTQVFQTDVQSYIRAATQSLQEQRGISLTADELQDVRQVTQMAFWRFASKRPGLLHSGEIGPLLQYLKLCAQSGIAQLIRKLPPDMASIAELPGEEQSDQAESKPSAVTRLKLPEQTSFTDEYLVLQEIVEELRKLLQNDLEQLVAQEVFLNDTPPRELVEDQGEKFVGDTKEAKLKQVNQILQTIRRRSKQAPYFQKLLNSRRKSDSSAFLHFSVENNSIVNEAKMPASEPCPFDETTLLEYVRGIASIENQVAIERSPACIRAVNELAADLQTLKPLLRLMLCPDVETLLDYYQKRLPGVQQLVIHKHVQGCRQCQAELAIFAAIDEVPAPEEGNILRRIIEALFLPPTLTASPVRGTLPTLHYRTQIRIPAIDILIYTQKQSGKARTWSMRGELRTDEGLQFTQVEQLILRGKARHESSHEVELSTSLEEDGMFIFRGLETGDYTLHVLTEDEEIVVRSIQVGVDI